MIKKTLFLAIVVLFSTCRKGETSWDIDALIPLGHAELFIDDLLADSLLETGDNNQIIFVWKQNILTIDLESIGTIPDTTIRNKFSLPFVTQFDFPAGSQFPTPDDQINLNVDQAKLTQGVIKEGNIVFSAINPISERLVVNYSLPTATLNDLPFTIIDTIPAAANGIPSTTTTVFDISGYELDLTGENGNEFNQLLTELTITTDPFGNTVTVYNTDTIKVDIKLQDIVPAYVIGSFDTQGLDAQSEEIEINLGDFMDANLNLQEVQSKLKIENGFGVDISFKLDELIGTEQSSGTSVALTHAIFGNTINLSRATDINGLIPFSTEITLDQNNSNIKAFIENLPDLIDITASGVINPLGNISGGNDFIYCDSRIKADLITEIPLEFSISGLVIKDTLILGEISNTDFEGINEARLIIELTNSFPLSLTPTFYLIDSNDLILLENEGESIVAGGILASGGIIIPQRTLVSFVIDKSDLNIIEINEAILIEIIFDSTDPTYPILSNHKLEIKIGLDANYDLHLN